MHKFKKRTESILPGVFSLLYAGFLISHLCLASIYIFVFPLRTYFLAAAFFIGFLLSISSTVGVIWQDEYVKKISLVFTAFICASFISFFFSKIFYADPLGIKNFLFLLVKFLVQLWMGFFISMIFLRQNGLRALLWLVVICAATSGAVAFFQFLGVGVFWKIKLFFTSNIDQYIVTFIASHNDSQRAAGLSLYFISLSYEMLLSLPLSVHLINRSVGKERWAAAFCAIFILLGLIASKTMSAYLAFVVMALLWLYGKGKRKITVILVLLALIGTYFFRDHLAFLLASFKARMGFWQVAVKTFLEYPFGIPFLRDYGQYSSHFYSPDLPDIVGSVPHNQFLNTAISYGWGGIISLILFFYVLYKRILQVKDRAFSLLMFCSFLGYFIHSFFHNLGMFYNDLFFWVIASVFFAKSEYENKGW